MQHCIFCEDEDAQQLYVLCQCQTTAICDYCLSSGSFTERSCPTCNIRLGKKLRAMHTEKLRTYQGAMTQSMGFGHTNTMMQHPLQMSMHNPMHTPMPNFYPQNPMQMMQMTQQQQQPQPINKNNNLTATRKKKKRGQDSDSDQANQQNFHQNYQNLQYPSNFMHSYGQYQQPGYHIPPSYGQHFNPNFCGPQYYPMMQPMGYQIPQQPTPPMNMNMNMNQQPQMPYPMINPQNRHINPNSSTNQQNTSKIPTQRRRKEFDQKARNLLLMLNKTPSFNKPQSDSEDSQEEENKPRRNVRAELLAHNQNKTTDYFEENTRNKTIRINRSNSVNNLTMKR